MENINFMNMANELLGDELYCKFIKEISKKYIGSNLVDFGNKIINNSCYLLIMIGLSNKIKLDNVKICLEGEVVEISCNEFAEKYKKYTKKVKCNGIISIDN